MSNNSDTLSELIPNNRTNFFRIQTKNGETLGKVLPMNGRHFPQS